MYKFVENGLTFAGRVWSKNTILSDKQAKKIGLNKWFKQTKGKAQNRQFVVYEEGEPPVELAKTDKKQEPKMQEIRLKTETIKPDPVRKVTIKTERVTRTGNKEEVKPKEEKEIKNQEVNTGEIKTELIKKIEEKGLTLTKVKGLSWKELTKLFGPKLAKKIKDL